MHCLLRDDIRKLDTYIADTRMMGKEGIETKSQLDAFYHRTSSTVEELAGERRPLYRIARNADNPDAAAKVRERIESINVRLKELRKTLHQCDRIAERSGVILEKIRLVEADAEMHKTVKQRGRER